MLSVHTLEMGLDRSNVVSCYCAVVFWQLNYMLHADTHVLMLMHPSSRPPTAAVAYCPCFHATRHGQPRNPLIAAPPQPEACGVHLGPCNATPSSAFAPVSVLQEWVSASMLVSTTRLLCGQGEDGGLPEGAYPGMHYGPGVERTLHTPHIFGASTPQMLLALLRWPCSKEAASGLSSMHFWLVGKACKQPAASRITCDATAGSRVLVATKRPSGIALLTVYTHVCTLGRLPLQPKHHRHQRCMLRRVCLHKGPTGGGCPVQRQQLAGYQA